MRVCLRMLSFLSRWSPSLVAVPALLAAGCSRRNLTIGGAAIGLDAGADPAGGGADAGARPTRAAARAARRRRRHPPHGRRRITLRQRRLPAALDAIGVDDRPPGRRHDPRRDRGGEPTGQAAGRPHLHARRRRHRRLPVRGRRAVPPLPRRPLPAGRARGHRRVRAPPRSIPTWSAEPASTARRRARPNTCWARSRSRRPPS